MTSEMEHELFIS